METFKMLKIKRSQIELAGYNPRTIDDAARKRLKKGMKKFGLVQPLVWNEKTGVLVSGHQRLSIMDELNKYPSKDYFIDVAAVSLSKKDEMTLNVQLNNQSMMGDFDIEALNGMLDLGADISDMGFSESDLDLMFSEKSAIDEISKDDENVQEAKETLSEIKEERAKMNKEKDAENSASYYFIVVCDGEAERTEFFKKMNVPLSEEYVSSKHLRRLAQALSSSR